jgi:transcriptional regulator with PAS, ATPase and Fis domain
MKTETNSNLDDIKFLARKQIESIMGKGKVICEIFSRIEEYAEQDSPLLIEGETGVEKKEIVTYLDWISSRRNKELVAIEKAMEIDNNDLISMIIHL